MTRELETRSRRRRRARYLLFSLPVVIALLYVATRLMGLSVVNGAALDLFDQARFESSAEKSTELLDETVVEPYIPWFNRGDAYAAQEKYTDAIDDFEKALELAPAERECDVRVNLALSWERLGDIYAVNGYPQGAIQLYQAAKTVIAEGDDCVPPEPSGEDLQKAGPRVDAKIEQSERQRDAADGDTGDGPGTLEEQLDELGQKSEAGEQDKATQDSSDRGEQSQQSGPPAKPW